MERVLLYLSFLISFHAVGQWNQLGGDINGVDSLDRLGISVAMNNSGDRVSICIKGTHPYMDDTSRVQVYDFDGEDWIQVGNDIVSENLNDEMAGSRATMDMDSSGNIIAVGAPNHDDLGSADGIAHVFMFDGVDWVQIGASIESPQVESHFGHSVSLSDDGTILAVGAGNYDYGELYNAGAVFVYQYDGVNWVPMGTEIVGVAEADFFSSYSLDLNSDGTILAAGSAHNDDGGDNAGHTRVFEFVDGDWVQMGTDIVGEDEDHGMGASVNLSANGLILCSGSYTADDADYNSGKVRVFQYDGTDWVQLGTDMLGTGSGDLFGQTAELSDDGYTCAIGAPGNDNIAGDHSGQVKVFKFYDDDWHLFYSAINGEAYGETSGNALGMNSDGTRIIVGAHHNDEISTYSGQVRIYEAEVCVSTSVSISENSCLSYTVPSGDETYEESGIYLDTIYNYCGADSIITIDLTILEPVFTNMEIVECDSFTVPSGEETYVSSGMYYDTLATALGCDSILVITLFIGGSTNEYSVFACDSFTVPSGDETHFNSGIYMDTISDIFGCDSILTIDLEIGNSFYEYSVTQCDSFLVPSGDEIYFSSGYYTDTLLNMVGCDSVLFIDVTINSVDAEIIDYSDGTFYAITDMDGYQWINCIDSAIIPMENNVTFSPTESGDYAVIVTQDGCNDTSDCVSFDNLSSYEGGGKLKRNSVKIYPNPFTVSTTVYVDLLTLPSYNIVIRNSAGKTVHDFFNLSDSSFELNNKNLAPGVYFLEVSGQEGYGVSVYKIIVI